MEEMSRVCDPKMEEVMLPGFRFHPTDEELVGFYLKKKVQGRPLSIELIKQLDIYKYDPWDLPKLASTGEKEWYFFCPRDRKYKNSTRPNRVTGAGFWKATGTDRPIYSSSQGSKCIGLKKSLVFYQGRAAKGVKTQWMMHEFRLPPSTTQERYIDNHIPANDSWAICRIFKKPNSSAQRSVSHSWVSPWPETTTSSHQICTQNPQSTQFTSPFHFSNSLPFPIISSASSPCLSPSDVTTTSSYNTISHKTVPQPLEVPILSTQALPTSCGFLASQFSEVDVSSLISIMPASVFGDSSSYILSLPEEELQIGNGFYEDLDDEQWRTIISPSSSSSMAMQTEGWRGSLLWDPSSCPSDISTNYSTTNECHI